MPVSEAQKKAKERYTAKMKRLELLLKPSEFEAIREGANREGLTVTRYLVQCHREHGERQDGNPENGE